MVCTIQLKSTLIYTFYCTGNEVIVPFTLVTAKFWHNYIQIISMKYFTVSQMKLLLNIIVSISYSQYFCKKYSNFIYDTVSMKLLFCIMNYFPSCYQHFLSNSITPFVHGNLCKLFHKNTYYKDLLMIRPQSYYIVYVFRTAL